jgi:MinD-like ATPase involved in chromosome partitioning or flagellar assembly
MGGVLTAVVAGFPDLARALSISGRFVQVFDVGSTGELRDLIGQRQLPDDKTSVVFLFSDVLTVNTPTGLEQLVSTLTTRGYKLIILGLTPKATDIVRANPGAGLLEGPFTTNITLGAISGLGGTFLEPTSDGFDIIDPTTAINAYLDRTAAAPATPPAPSPTTQPVPAPFHSAATPPAPAPVPAEHEAPAPWSSPGAGWATPKGDVAPGTTSPVLPTTAPAAPAPQPFVPTPPPVVAHGPFSPAPASPQPFTTAPAPAEQPRRVLTPPGATPSADAPATFRAPGARPLMPRADGGLVPTTAPASPGTYLDFAPQPGGRHRARIISVTSPKGGTGKSTLTLNMAAYLALRLKESGKRVCVIDANFQQADAGKMLGQYSPTVIDVVKDMASLSPTGIERYLVHRNDLNLSVLLGPARPEEGDPAFLNARLFNQITDALSSNYDYIFIDTPVAEVYHDLFQGFILPRSDYIIVPVTPVLHTMMNVDNWLHTVTLPRHTGGNDVDANKVGLVLNQAEEGVNIGEEEVRRELFKWNFIGSIPRSRAWINAVNTWELVATKNYHELNDAFSRILWTATGEQILLTTVDTDAGPSTKRSPGLLGRLRSKRTKG